MLNVSEANFFAVQRRASVIATQASKFLTFHCYLVRVPPYGVCLAMSLDRAAANRNR
jgi:hypothetical protein